MLKYDCVIHLLIRRQSLFFGHKWLISFAIRHTPMFHQLTLQWKVSGDDGWWHSINTRRYCWSLFWCLIRQLIIVRKRCGIIRQRCGGGKFLLESLLCRPLNYLSSLVPSPIFSTSVSTAAGFVSLLSLLSFTLWLIVVAASVSIGHVEFLDYKAVWFDFKSFNSVGPT